MPYKDPEKRRQHEHEKRAKMTKEEIEKKKAKDKARRERDKEKIAARNREYREKNKTVLKEYMDKWRGVHREDENRKKREKNRANPEENKRRCKEYLENHREKNKETGKVRYKKMMSEAKRDVRKLAEIRELNRKRMQAYRERLGKEKCNGDARKWRAANPVSSALSYKRYRKLHPEYTKKHNAQRRELGYMPMNSAFKGSHFHHMHLTNADGTKNKSIGIHIPEKLHTSVRHNHRTGEGMAEINKRALKWLVIMQRRLK